MELNEVVILIVTGAVAGWLAGLILRRGGLNIIGNIVVGVIGAFIGEWVFELIGVSFEIQWLDSLVTATVGAVILLLVVGGFVHKKKK